MCCNTITSNTYFWNIFHFAIDAVIVDSGLNVTLNINRRAESPRRVSEIIQSNQLLRAVQIILFTKFLNCISTKQFIMHSNTMPLSRLRQTSSINNSLVIHPSCSNSKDCYRPPISQDLLHRGLPNPSTNYCL